MAGVKGSQSTGDPDAALACVLLREADLSNLLIARSGTWRRFLCVRTPAPLPKPTALFCVLGFYLRVIYTQKNAQTIITRRLAQGIEASGV